MKYVKPEQFRSRKTERGKEKLYTEKRERYGGIRINSVEIYVSQNISAWCWRRAKYQAAGKVFLLGHATRPDASRMCVCA